jgi:hypothetical protein
MRVLQPSQDQLYPKSSNKLIFSSSVIENLPLYLGRRRIILTTHALIPKLIRGHIILPGEALLEDKSVKTDPKAAIIFFQPRPIYGLSDINKSPAQYQLEVGVSQLLC